MTFDLCWVQTVHMALLEPHGHVNSLALAVVTSVLHR